MVFRAAADDRPRAALHRFSSLCAHSAADVIGRPAPVVGAMEIAKALILAGRAGDDRPWPTAPRRPEAPVPGRQPPDPVPQPRGAARRGRAARRRSSSTPARRRGDRARRRRRPRVGPDRRATRDWDPADGVGGALAVGRELPRGRAGAGPAGRRAAARAHARAHRRVRARGPGRPRAAPASRRSAPGAGPGYLLSPRAVSILLDGPARPANPVAGVRAARRPRPRPARRRAACPATATRTRCWTSNRRDARAASSRRTTRRSLEDCTRPGPGASSTRRRACRAHCCAGPLIIGPDARITDAYVGPVHVDRRGRRASRAPRSSTRSCSPTPSCASSAPGSSPASSAAGPGSCRGFELPGAMRMSVGDGAEVDR